MRESRVLRGPEDDVVDAGNVATALPEGIDKSLPARLERLARHGDAAILASDPLTFIRLQDQRRAVELARADLTAAENDEQREACLVVLADAMRKLQGETN